MPLAIAACRGGAASDDVTLLDLVAELETARTRPETVVLDFGSAAAREHLVAGLDERSVVGEVWRTGGRHIGVAVDVAVPRDARLTLRARARVDDDTPLDVFLNSRPVGRITLERRYREHTIDVAAEYWQAGENLLRFAIPPEAPLPSGLDWDRLVVTREFEFAPGGGLRVEGPGQTSSLSIPFGTRLDYSLRIPEGARLRIDRIGSAGTSGSLGVIVADDDRGAVELARVDSVSSVESGLDVPLPRSSSGVIRLSLLAASGTGAPEGSGLLLSGARVQVPAPVAIPVPPTAVPAQPAPVIVFMIDTLRADRLGTYGYERPTSPRIDRFAGEAVLFAEAVAPSAWTKPTVASIFTGLHPPSHGVVELNRILAPGLDTMAELFSQSGYETAGFVTITTVSSAFGYEQGFDRYEEMLERDDLPGLHEPAERVVDVALDWIDARPDPDRPFFLYVHVSDPHAPYVPPAPYAERFAPGVEPLDEADLAAAPESELQGIAARASDLYDAEVAYVDEQFGRFVDELRDRGILQRSTVVLMADHGEEFLDHGGWGHGRTLHGELVRVPLILRLPDERAVTGRVAARVRQVDILPTLLALNGLPPPDRGEGASMVPLLDADGLPRAAHGHLRVRGRYQDSIADGSWKLIVSGDALGPRQLFDLHADPAEQRDLAEENPIMVEYLYGLLRQLDRRFAAAATPAEETTLDPAVEARLRALGYIR